MENTHELYLAAKELMEDPAFKKAVLQLRQRWFAEFLSSSGEVTAAVWRGKLQALEAVPNELQVIMNDYIKEQREAMKKQRHG